MNPTNDHVIETCDRIFAAIPLIDSMTIAGKMEIVDALVRNCQNDQHVDTVLRTFQETVLEWKNPIAELVKIAKETATPDRAPDGCDRCEDPAWKHDPQRPRWLPHVDVYGADGTTLLRVDYCDCSRGQWLRERNAAGGPR